MSDEAKSPYIPASTSLPEITVTTVALGAVLSVVLAGANMYLGLFAGLTVSASIPAAVISMALLKVIGGNILQNNSVQTAASAGESLAAGVIFTIPAMVMLEVWDHFHYMEVTLLAGFGGILGVMFTIPLRRALIVDQPLKFPEGVATAEVLKVGDQGGGGVRFIAIGGAVGALFKLGASGLKLFKETAAYAFDAGGSLFYMGTNLSPALLGVGYIVGLNIAVLVFLGGAANWLVAIPVYASAHGIPEADSLIDAAGSIWSNHTRYLGVGAMLVGGVWALIRMSGNLTRGIRASLKAYKHARSGAGQVPRTQRDTPMQVVIIVAGVSVLPLFFIFHYFTGSVGISAFMAVFMVIAGFLFSAVAAYMAGLVGSSNNPISGVTIATILVSALLLKLMGMDSKAGPAAAILIGSVVCCAAAIGGDNMQDLKAGHIVGSTPRKLQVMQVVGVLSAVFFMAPLLNVLHEAYVIGSDALSAPQSALMKAVSSGIFKDDLPWGMVGIGAVIAAGVIAVDLVLESKKSEFRTPVLAFAVGIYLPFELSVPIFIGGLLAHYAAKFLDRRGDSEDDKKTSARHGLLFAAGLITGEALVGILLAIPIAIAKDQEVLSLGVTPLAVPGLILLSAVAFLLYRAATKKS